jgi:hypothetical protein
MMLLQHAWRAGLNEWVIVVPIPEQWTQKILDVPVITPNGGAEENG